jgi:periplasmic protein TonB
MAMNRRLFEQALVLPSGGRGAWPASAVLHAGIASVLLAVPAFGPLTIPEPHLRPITTVDYIEAIVPVQGMPVAPRGAATRGGRPGPSLRPPAAVAFAAAEPAPMDAPVDVPEVGADDAFGDPQVFSPGGDGNGSPIGTYGVGPSAGEPAVAPALVRPGGLVQPPTKLRHVQPVYPDLAIRARVQAVVVLECVIDPSGHVAEVKVLRGHPLLDDAALAAVRQWVYSPTRLNNVPVAVLLTVTVQFRIPR